MATIILTLDPAALSNPDLDIRYALPELLVRRSGGTISDDGYDYSEDQKLLFFLHTDDIAGTVALVTLVLQEEQVLGNDLRNAASITVET